MRCVNRRGASPAHVRASVEGSLTRLGTDRIDLYYLHRFDRHTDIDHAAHARRARHGGQDPAHRGEQFRRLAGGDRASAAVRSTAGHRSSLLQPMYNLVKRQVEVELLPLARSADLAVFPYSPLAGGLLEYGTTPGSVRGGWSRTRCTACVTATRAASSPPPSSMRDRRRGRLPSGDARRGVGRKPPRSDRTADRRSIPRCNPRWRRSISSSTTTCAAGSARRDARATAGDGP